MKKLVRVYCYNIEYYKKDTIIGISGPQALQNYVEEGFLTLYDHTCAPKDLEVEVYLEPNFLDNLDETETIIKEQLEEDAGIKVENFSFRIFR